MNLFYTVKGLYYRDDPSVLIRELYLTAIFGGS